MRELDGNDGMARSEHGVLAGIEQQLGAYIVDDVEPLGDRYEMMRYDEAAAAMLQANGSLSTSDDTGFQMLVVEKKFIVRECLAEPSGQTPPLGNIMPGGAGTQMGGIVRAGIFLLFIMRAEARLEMRVKIRIAGGRRVEGLAGL